MNTGFQALFSVHLYHFSVVNDLCRYQWVILRGDSPMRSVKVAHVLASRVVKGGEQFLFFPHRGWQADGRPMLTPLTKKIAPGSDQLPHTIEALEKEGFDGEVPPAGGLRVLPLLGETLHSPTQNVLTHYEIVPVLAAYPRGRHERRAERLGGLWMTRTEALRHPTLSPTARLVLQQVRSTPAGPLDPKSQEGSWTSRMIYARDHDQRAFGPLFEEMKGWLAKLLWTHFPSPVDVEDVLSETALMALSHLQSFDANFTAGAWLATIARNAETSVLRQRVMARQVSLSGENGPLPIIDDAPGPARLTEEADDMAFARARLNQEKATMSPVRRLAWRLRYEEEMDYAEIADTLKLPEGTVATWIHRTRQRLLGEGREQ
jgi:RNA polymerase sigma-70 factor, ECF subfamily